MAQYKIKDREDEIECPFDNTHMVRISRMQYHIMKCRKNFPNIHYEQCTFNARHWVLRAELAHHLANCPDRAVIHNDFVFAQKENNGSYFHGNCSVPEYRDHQIADPSGENWDDECDVQRGTFKWGRDTVDEYFSPDLRRDNEPEPPRLPRGIPQVLRSQASGQYNPGVGTQASGDQMQRMPKSLPVTLGLGRGRGYGTKKAATPAVGASQRNGHVQQAPFGMNGLGRGYGQPSVPSAAAAAAPATTAATTNGHVFGIVPTFPSGNGNIDDDARSTSSSVSMSSDRSDSVGSSSSSQSRGKPRRINAPPLRMAMANSIATNKPEQPAPVTNGTVSSDEEKRSSKSNSAANRPMQGVRPSLNPAPGARAPVFSSMGIGRGGGRGYSAQPTVGQLQPQFIVPNVNTQEKNLRKYEKKLREIEALEEKRNMGVDLNEDEVSKVTAKAHFLDLMKNIRETN